MQNIHLGPSVGSMNLIPPKSSKPVYGTSCSDDKLYNYTHTLYPVLVVGPQS